MAGGDLPTVKGHSSRKNKPQRCSVCGGIGHKSRTCSMAVTPNTQAMCQPVQWAATQPGMVQAGTDPTTGQMTYVPVQGGWQPAPGQVAGQGGMVMTAQGAMMQTGAPMAQLTPQQQAQLAQQMAMQQQMQAQQMVQMPNPVSGGMVMTGVTGVADGGAVAVEAGVAQAVAADEESAGEGDEEFDGALDSAADVAADTDALEAPVSEAGEAAA